MAQKIRDALLESLRHRYRAFLGIAIATGLLAWLILFILLPPTYRATALIFMTDDLYDVVLSGRLQPRETTDDLVERADIVYSVLHNIVLSPDMLSRVYTAAQPNILDPGDSLEDLIDDAEAFVYNRRGSLLQLSIEANRPEQATDLVNLWLDIAVTHLNDLLSLQVTGRQALADALLAASEQQLAAEAAVVAFEARNDIEQRRTDLRVIRDDIAGLQYRATELATLRISLERFAQWMNQREATAQVELGDYLSYMGLQWRTFEVANLGIEYDVANVMTGLDYGTLVNQINTLLTQIDALQTIVLQQVDELETTTLVLQEQIAALDIEAEHVYRELDLQRQTTLLLERSLAELGVADAATNVPVRVAARGIMPEEPTDRLLKAALGLVAGGISALLVWCYDTYRRWYLVA